MSSLGSAKAQPPDICHAEPAPRVDFDLDLSTRVRTLESDLEACQTARAELLRRYNKLQSEVDGKDARIAELERQVEVLARTLSELRNQEHS